MLFFLRVRTFRWWPRLWGRRRIIRLPILLGFWRRCGSCRRSRRRTCCWSKGFIQFILLFDRFSPELKSALSFIYFALSCRLSCSAKCSIEGLSSGSTLFLSISRGRLWGCACRDCRQLWRVLQRVWGTVRKIDSGGRVWGRTWTFFTRSRTSRRTLWHRVGAGWQWWIHHLVWFWIRVST